MNRRHILRGGLVAAVAAAFGSGCSEPPPPSNIDLEDPGQPVAKPTPSPSREPAPLFGAPPASDAVVVRPALAVPIRVAADSSPAGVTVADLIYQEYAESDTLHVTAVFQSRDAARIGPVTEVRPVDIRTLTVLRPLVAYTGGPTGFLTQFRQSGLRGVTPAQQAGAFSSGYTSTKALYRLVPAGTLPPPAIFDYATVGAPLASRDVVNAGELRVTAPGHPTQVWVYDAQHSTWRGRLGKVPVAASSVFVLTMPYRTLTVRKPSPRTLPAANVFGTGTAVVVSGPSSAKAKWRKPGPQAVCHVTDLAGDQIRPLPGPAWVVYAPPSTKVTVK